MSRGAPPIQPLSAVPQQVGQQLQAAGQMNLQQQQINNQAAAQQQQMQLQRQQMQQERDLSEDALRQRTMESLLQTENYAKLNANNLQIARERNAQAEATRRQAAEQANLDREMQSKIHADNMRMQKESDALKIEMAMIGSIAATPEQQARLKELNIKAMEQATKIREAELIAAGRLDEASNLRRQTERQIREMADGISTALERPVGALNDKIVGADPYKYFDLEQGVVGAITNVASLGLYTEPGYDLGAGAANIFLPEESEIRGLKEKNIMDALEADPEMARPAILKYHSDLFKTAVESAFPQADANALSASYMGLIAGIEGYTPERREKAMQMFLDEARQAGVDPMMMGELMRRVDASKEQELARLRDAGISPAMGPDQVVADDTAQFLKARFLRGNSGIRIAHALFPSLAPYEEYADTLASDRELSLDEIETMVGGFGRYGMEAPDELEALVSALSGYEGAVKDISDLRFEEGMGDLRFEEATTDIEMDIARRRQAALEDIRNRLLGE